MMRTLFSSDAAFERLNLSSCNNAFYRAFQQLKACSNVKVSHSQNAQKMMKIYVKYFFICEYLLRKEKVSASNKMPGLCVRTKFYEHFTMQSISL